MTKAERSDYVLSRTDKSFCPNCHGPVRMLAPYDMTKTKAWFYICFVCQKVFRVGKGPVRETS